MEERILALPFFKMTARTRAWWQEIAKIFAAILLSFGTLPGIAIAQEAATKAVRVQTAVAAAAHDSSDGADFAETPGYRELVAALLEVKPPEVETLDPSVLDLERALNDPAAVRGQWVRVRGYVMLKHSEPLSSPIGTATRIERTIMKLDATHHIVCDLIGDPPPFKTQADTMEVCGVFFRTVSYEANTGKRVTLPYVLARTMELVETPSSGLAKSLLHGSRELLFGLVLGLVGVIVFVMYLRRSGTSET